MVSSLACRTLRPGDSDYATELSGFNLAITHSPDLVVAAEHVDDVVETVRYARQHGQRIAVQNTGHGTAPVQSGILLSTRSLTDLSIDPTTGIASIGAGLRWKTVVQAGAEHGLTAITGSSPDVGSVGFLLGGGIGPLVRSHGFGSDYVTGFTVVTGTGEVLDVDATNHPDLFWALRGGKFGLGIVTEVRVRLVPLKTIYGGSLWFSEEHIETAFRAWIDWTKIADSQVTTSGMIASFPPFDFMPEPMRGRTLLSVRFAYPGDLNEGEHLAEPLRAIAPIYIDDLGEMTTTDMGRIHSDPDQPVHSWVAGGLLGPIDQDFATIMLDQIRPGEQSPFMSVEVRHIGGAGKVDVPEGSAASGRFADYAFASISANPEMFSAADAAMDTLAGRIDRYLTPYTNINFTGDWRTDQERQRAWAPEVAERLASIRKKYDPDGVFAR